MAYRIAMIALGALCCFFSGCGCSKEKPEPVKDGPSRMRDVSYTNQLVQLHEGRRVVAAKVAEIRAKLAKLGADAEKSPEYADLTNQLAKCEAESQRIRKEAIAAVRTRVLKEAGPAQKGNLKK